MQIRDGRDGFLVEPNDIDGCADRVVELLKNKTLCEQFGITAKEMIKEKFLITRLLGDYLDLINDIL
jgi:trehalose synthase